MSEKKALEKPMKTCFVLLMLMLAGCVNVDPQTGKTIPRGKQKYEFETVERRAKQLKDGMSKYDVLVLLGWPAETSGDGEIWTYLPERPAVLVPSHALQLTFANNVLIKHENKTIIFGQTAK